MKYFKICHDKLARERLYCEGLKWVKKNSRKYDYVGELVEGSKNSVLKERFFRESGVLTVMYDLLNLELSVEIDT